MAKADVRPMTKTKRQAEVDPAVMREIIDLQHRARETDKRIEETRQLLQEARRRLQARSVSR